MGTHSGAVHHRTVATQKRSASGIKVAHCPHCGVKAGAQWIQYLLSLLPDIPVAAYCVHTSLPVLVPGVPQQVVTGSEAQLYENVR